MARKILRGRIISDKMDKTVVVLVEKKKEHPIYRKKYTVSKKYKAHNPENKYKVGDEVEIIETKPISKEKRWEVISKVKSKKAKSQVKSQK